MSVIAEEFTVPEIVTASATIFVTDAEYVPSPLSLTVLITALPVEDSVTVPPLVVRGLPLASASVTTTLEVVEPSAATLVGDVASVVFPLVGSAGGKVLLKLAVGGKLKPAAPGCFHRKRSLSPPAFS